MINGWRKVISFLILLVVMVFHYVFTLQWFFIMFLHYMCSIKSLFRPYFVLDRKYERQVDSCMEISNPSLQALFYISTRSSIQGPYLRTLSFNCKNTFWILNKWQLLKQFIFVNAELSLLYPILGIFNRLYQYKSGPNQPVEVPISVLLPIISACIDLWCNHYSCNYNNYVLILILILFLGKKNNVQISNFQYHSFLKIVLYTFSYLFLRAVIWMIVHCGPSSEEYLSSFSIYLYMSNKVFRRVSYVVNKVNWKCLMLLCVSVKVLISFHSSFRTTVV